MERKIFLSNGSVLIYEFTPKRIKNINVRISREGQVKVSAPTMMPISKVEDFILKKQVFICKAVNFAVKNTNNGYLFKDKIEIFGVSYPIKRIISNKNELEFVSNTIYIYSDGSQEAEKKLIDKFILSSAKALLPKILEDALLLFTDYKIPYPQLKFRIMKTRWGTCDTVKKIVTLNANLILYPKTCAKYVICHELSHLIVADHSKKFYLVLASVMPDYKRQKSILKNYYQK